MDNPRGAPNAADSAHRETPPRAITFGASGDFESFRETLRVSPPDSIQSSHTAPEAEELQTKALSAPEGLSAEEEDSQQLRQQTPKDTDSFKRAANLQSARDDGHTEAEETIGHQEACSQVGCSPPTTGQLQFLQDCWILEVFAGNAGIVAAATAEGLRRSIRVDHVRLASRKGKVIQLDLLLASRRQLLWKWLRSPGLVAVWVAPPCGTASRAREIPLEGDLAPQPLRTPEYPEGRPDLDTADADRVNKANSLYHTTAEIWEFCLENSILVVIENPYRSLFWHMPEISSILQDDRAVLVRCDFCMFGGRRLKKTALLSNNHLIHALAAQCDGQHEHLSWGVVEGEFATKQESAYTDLFCRTFVLTLTRHLRGQGWKDERDVHGSHEHGPAAAKVLTAKACTKRAASFRMLPEFKQTLRWSLASSARHEIYRPAWMPVDRIPGLEVETVGEVRVSPILSSSTDVWVDVPIGLHRSLYGKLAGRATHLICTLASRDP